MSYSSRHEAVISAIGASSKYFFSFLLSPYRVLSAALRRMDVNRGC